MQTVTKCVVPSPDALGHFSKPALDHHLSRALRQDAAA